MDMLKMRKAILLRKLKDEQKEKGEGWLEEWMSDPEKALEEMEREPQPSTFENLPLVSVQPRNVIFVQFVTEPEIKPTQEGERPRAFADVLMLKAARGWNSQEKRETLVKVGDKAAINLMRHTILWRIAKANFPLKNKKFVIANLGKVKTRQGYACNYAWKEIKG